MHQISNGLANTNVVAANRAVQQATVEAISTLSEDLILVHFTDHAGAAAFFPGQEISFYIDDLHIRRYTVSTVDHAERSFSVLFYCHGKGPGGNWVLSLRHGDKATFTTEPGQLLYNDQATHHFFFGDETALGLFYGYKEIALQNNHEYFGVLELQPHNEPVLTSLKLLVDAVPPEPGIPAHHALLWMDDMHPNCWKAWEKAAFYLAGRALSVKQFRMYLQQKQVAARQIHIMAYWAD